MAPGAQRFAGRERSPMGKSRWSAPGRPAALLGVLALVAVAVIGARMLHRVRERAQMSPAAQLDILMAQASRGFPSGAMPGPGRAGGGVPSGDTIAALAAAVSAARSTASRAQGIGASVQVVGETANSVHLALRLPGGEAVDETITLQPNVSYTPTAADLDAQARTGQEIFGPRISQLADPAGGKRLVLQYVVPTASLPQPLRDRLDGKPTALLLHLFSEAWAQNTLNLWTGIATGYQNKASIPGSDLMKVYKNYEKVQDALDTSDQYSQWMSEFDAMEECARNPTQTVTQNAYHDNPQYQQQTLDAIAQARSEASQATALSFLNQETSTAMQLTSAPGLLKDMTKSVSKWNAAALRDIGNTDVHDAGGLVDCDLAPPPYLKGGDGTLQYHMRREGYQGFVTENHIVRLNLEIQRSGATAAAGGYELTGDGDFKSKVVSKYDVGTVECMGTSAARGGGAGDYLRISGGPSGGKCGPDRKIYGSIYHTDIYHSDNAFQCEFRGIDPVNGGRYEVRATGEEAPYTTCTLELKPRQQ